ncbi:MULTISPECIES: hypothetical protein [Streptomyces]|uniref:Uncharacterized protein n=2 Tax=Streptomyces TaxID=1883 RepID=A0A0W7X1N5_9ACTN|nr:MULTISPECIES: hypothetical protein [Streptomyces]KUF16780.1 hypothetical protein AT728_22930 [Streptomyces silvensis]MVO88773.1 hypothetical protein [Streptomyces typhae]
MAQKPQINIIAVVDVIGALSGRTLQNGNLCLVDNGDHSSTGQGTTDLCTFVRPGQVVQWSALAVDLQTPVDIKSITFLGPDGTPSPLGRRDANGESEKLDLEHWAGMVPPFLPPGVPHRYRLELQMYEGEHSVLHVDTPALLRV